MRVLHLHDGFHEFRLSLGCTTSHILCEILWDEVPWDAISISDPSAHLRFRLCGEVLVIIIQIFLTLTWYHPRGGTWVMEIGSTIQRRECITSKKREFDDHDISGLGSWNMRISLVVESCCRDVRVRKYRAVVFCHFESIVVVRPEASGEHKKKRLVSQNRWIYIPKSWEIWVDEYEWNRCNNWEEKPQRISKYRMQYFFSLSRKWEIWE